eukprot:gene11471-biopygen11778
MSEQIASPSAEVAASKTEDSPLPSTPTKNKGAEAELERRRNLRYVPESLDNPFPTRPKNLDSDMPQMYAMYEDKSYDSLNKKSASSMKYEYAVLAPALSYFHVFHKHTVIELDDLEKNDLYNRLVCLENSLNGVYTLLCSLFSILQLRASIDGEGVSKTDADSLRAKLKFVEDCVYSGTEGLVTDTLLKEYLAEFDKGKNKAAMYANMKHAALGRRGTRELEVGGVGATTRRSKVPLEERTRAKVAASHRAELRLKARDVLGTPLGAKMRWLRRPPPRFDHGVSLRDANPQQQIWLNEEIKRALGSGAWRRATKREHVSRVFLVKKPGTNKWRLIVDMKWLNSFCVKSKVKMETLKKLRRLAEPGDWCFSFDLQDGNHADGIDPDFQKYMQFDLQGQLFQFSALPFGSSDAPRVFVKFMKVMVEALRSPGAAEDRRELLKLKDGRVATPRYEVRRRAGGVHRDLRRRGARVLPYMDDFLILALTKEETYVQREHVRQVLARLGLCRNEKKGQWEPGQLIEHLGLEVYLRDGEADATGLPRSGVVAPAAGDEPVEWSENLEKSDEGEAPHGQFFAVWGGVLNLDKEARGFWPDELRHLHITLLELEAVFKTMQSFMRELEGKVVRLYCDNQAVVAMLSHFTSRNPELMRRMRRLWLLLDLHDIELQAQYIRSEANEWADRLSRCEDIDDWRLNRPRFVGADSAWGPHTVDRFASEILAQLPRYFAWWHDPRCEGVDSLAYDWRGEINWVNPPWALLDEEGPLRPEPPEAVNDSSCAEVQQPTGAAAEPVPVGTRLQIHWELDDAWYPGAVVLFNEDGFVNIVYDDGDEEVVDLANERYKNIGDVETPIGVKNIFGEKDILLTDSVGTSDPPVVTEKVRIKTPGFLEQAVCLRWKTELGTSEHSELAVQMQQAALQPTTKGNYDPKPYLSAINNYHEDLQYEAPAKGRSVIRAVKGMAVLQANQQVISDEVLTERTYLPAQHVWAAQQAATAMTPKTLEELRLLRACVYTVFAYVTFGRPDTGVAMQREHICSTVDVLSVVLLKEKGRRHHQVKRRLQIPWKGVTGLREALENWQVHRDLAWENSTSLRTPTDNVAGSYWRLPGERGAFEGASLANEWIQLALGLLGCIPPEGGHFTAHSTRKGAATAARAVGTMLERDCFFGGWAQTSSAVHRYIDPTAVPDEYIKHFFGWMAP